jgi:hypothetical protein
MATIALLLALLFGSSPILVNYQPNEIRQGTDTGH